MFHVSSMCRVVLVLFSCISTFYCTVLTWWLCHLRQNCCVRFGGVGEECCVGKWFILPQNICAWIVVGHRIDMHTYSLFFTNTLIFLRLLLRLICPSSLICKWNQDKWIYARWVSEWASSWNVCWERNSIYSLKLVRPKIQHPTSNVAIFISKQGEVFLFSHHSFVFPSNPICVHA